MLARTRTLGALLLWGAAAARAQTPSAAPSDAGHRASLRWTVGPRAAGCPDGAALERIVEAHLGRAAFGSGPPTLRIVGEVDRNAEGWRVSLAFEGADGEALGRRVLRRSTGRCEQLQPAIALVLALMIESPTDEAVLTLPPAPEPAPVAGSAAPRRSPDRPRPDSAPRGGPRVRSGFDVGLSVGIVPGAAVHGGLRVEVTARRWSAGVALRATQGRAATEPGGGGVEVSAWHLTPATCGHLGRVWRLSLCAGLDVGTLRGAGFGFADARTARRLHLGATVSARLSIEGGAGVAPFVEIAGGPTLVRPRFYARVGEREVTLWRVWPAALSVRAGIAFGR